MTTTSAPPTAGGDSYPRLHARTRRFTLGRPRALVVRDDGGVLFLRSRAGDDPVTSLWLRTPEGDERLVVDAAALGVDQHDLPPEERARRERAREQAGGIVAYTTDRDGDQAALAVGGRLFVVDVDVGRVRAVEGPTGVFSPVLDPTGTRVCWVADGALWVTEVAGDAPTPRRLCADDAPTVSWGAAEFVAAEEMGRMRGAWWSPDGRRLAVARVDVAPVDVWRISDPSDPAAEPTEHRYPPAGSANAEVTLHVVDLDGDRVEVAWDRTGFEYLAAVRWDAADDDGADGGRGPGRLSLLVQSRDQRRVQLLVADPGTGATTVVREVRDEAWVSLVAGTPAWSGDDDVLVVPVSDGEHGTDALQVGGRVVTPPGLQVRAVLRATPDAAWFAASRDDPSALGVWRWERDPASEGEVLVEVLGGAERAVSAVVGERALVAVHAEVRAAAGVTVGPTVTSRAPASPGGPGPVPGPVASLALDPGVVPAPRFLRLGPRRCPAALFLPTDDEGGALPVLLDPYGGPGHGRVVRSREAHLTSQWLADQGFAVLVTDNRGAPGVGPAWERGIHRDLATPVLVDQVDALHAAADVEPRLDLARVGIRGWSFGGFLAALAVLRRPDVFRAGVAGAPVTDWRLYDTHYTERYLGRPQDDPAAYAVSSLVDADGHLLGAVEPPDPHDPPALLLVHGLADDNVVAAHALRLSGALLAAGRPHAFLPLTGVTHMTPQEVVAENLLRLQVDFLHRALAPRPAGPAGAET